MTSWMAPRNMSSFSNSKTDSASWDGTLCTTPTTLSSSKNNFEAGDDSFDYCRFMLF